MNQASVRHNPLWIFGVTNLILNANGLFAAVPFLLRRSGVSVPQIASVVSITFIPSFAFFLWAPVVEIGMSRRRWGMLLYALTSALQFLALLQPLPTHLVRFAAFMFAANVPLFCAVGLNGPLVRDTVAQHLRPRAGGWIYGASMVSAGGAGLIMWLAEHLSRLMLATSVAAMGLIPFLGYWFLHEPPRSATQSLGEQVHAIARDLHSGFQLRSVREGLVIFLSPMSAAVLTFLFSGVAIDFHVSAHLSALLGGFAWTIAGAVGALLGGRFAGRVGPSRAYPAAAIVAGLCGLGILLASRSSLTYALGTTAYVAIGGCCGAIGVSLMIELTADAGHAASAWFAALWAATNVPWTYMQWADGQGYKHFGLRGMLAFDAVGNAFPAIVFLLYVSRRNSRDRIETPGQIVVSEA